MNFNKGDITLIRKRCKFLRKSWICLAISKFDTNLSVIGHCFQYISHVQLLVHCGTANMQESDIQNPK